MQSTSRWFVAVLGMFLVLILGMPAPALAFPWEVPFPDVDEWEGCLGGPKVKYDFVSGGWTQERRQAVAAALDE